MTWALPASAACGAPGPACCVASVQAFPRVQDRDLGWFEDCWVFRKHRGEFPSSFLFLFLFREL